METKTLKEQANREMDVDTTLLPGSIKAAMKQVGAGSSDLWKVPANEFKKALKAKAGEMYEILTRIQLLGSVSKTALPSDLLADLDAVIAGLPAVGK
jgi:hypothetical protein